MRAEHRAALDRVSDRLDAITRATAGVGPSAAAIDDHGPGPGPGPSGVSKENVEENRSVDAYRSYLMPANLDTRVQAAVQATRAEDDPPSSWLR
ncbi:hypothetical protein E5720_03890 [Rhodococcus sp. PAMC28707]|uniref:hypothetical protein n=1 Tax=unclassified Rhodococcus (in: high G+C Gram-positive bacteria) TaxID=192944 RepID=UPI00109DD56F|nr:MULTISPECIES: hypothetical protein [unclassified Rhodococcus (in: high G+C Gram-positive bacteria)]QCB50555.1 hypothetical protein E5769_10125 [Rhodococcus sp. PAMC28705]QCB57753.1 hypothetical protein E5720_03890 [Rhodococcus sp. PAMC28707]